MLRAPMNRTASSSSCLEPTMIPRTITPFANASPATSGILCWKEGERKPMTAILPS
ncbi:hypothetical protein BDV41DRAFT_559218 [Aspergillus transmontanensis]|uniref:Uncharacterized protein n=1 Tax=Aspergillus transmontanensis TaxID=1034304 RepID=A0A5N6VCS3_9EURO|nr:hypothetical protein BDV41DRAFT_559218 [Aspergillus transmontanensis]